MQNTKSHLLRAFVLIDDNVEAMCGQHSFYEPSHRCTIERNASFGATYISVRRDLSKPFALLWIANTIVIQVGSSVNWPYVVSAKRQRIDEFLLSTLFSAPISYGPVQCFFLTFIFLNDLSSAFKIIKLGERLRQIR